MRKAGISLADVRGQNRALLLRLILTGQCVTRGELSAQSGLSSMTVTNIAAELLQISAMTIVLFTLVQATSGILQGAGKQQIPMLTLVAGVVMKIALNYTLVRRADINIHGAPWASLLCYTVSLIPNMIYVCRCTGYRFSLAEVVLKPLGCSLVMGGVVWLIWHFGFGDPGHLNGFVLVAGILLCVAAGILTYGFLALATRTVHVENLPDKVQRLLRRLGCK